MKLGQFDKGGRRTPEPVTNSEFIIGADLVIAAIGQTPDLSYLDGHSMKVSKSGAIEAHAKTLATGMDGIYAAGDTVRGPATAVEAVADGKTAAMAIDKFLGGDGKPMNAYRDELVQLLVTYNEAEYQKERSKVEMPHLPVSKRSKNFNEVVLGYQANAAVEEAKRCLHCYLRESE
jgi:formate dehydrogenase major subunit